ncbi:MAG: hypothetical protein ACAI38_05740 [Myxococcota bacterium]
MSSGLLQEGLEAYARGDYAAAARAWSRGQREAPNDKTLLQYLQHLRGQQPKVVEAAEQELEPASAAVVAKASDPALTVVRPAVPPGKDPWGEHALLGPPAIVSSDAPVLAIVANTSRGQPSAASSLDKLLARLRDAAELDDFSSTLKLADEIIAIDPANAEARRARDRSRAVLTQMHISELGTLDAIPMVAVAADEIIWLDLDQRSGFVLAQIDGRSSYNDIVSVTGMDELETLAILSRLAKDKIISAR